MLVQNLPLRYSFQRRKIHMESKKRFPLKTLLGKIWIRIWGTKSRCYSARKVIAYAHEENYSVGRIWYPKNAAIRKNDAIQLRNSVTWSTFATTIGPIIATVAMVAVALAPIFSKIYRTELIQRHLRHQKPPSPDPLFSYYGRENWKVKRLPTKE